MVGHVDDLMPSGPRSGLNLFLDKPKSVYDLTLTFLVQVFEKIRKDSFLDEVFAGNMMV